MKLGSRPRTKIQYPKSLNFRGFPLSLLHLPLRILSPFPYLPSLLPPPSLPINKKKFSFSSPSPPSHVLLLPLIISLSLPSSPCHLPLLPPCSPSPCHFPLLPPILSLFSSSPLSCSEMVNFMSSPSSSSVSHLSVSVLYSHFDALRLSSVVGTVRSKNMIATAGGTEASKKIHTFVTGREG